MLGIACPYRPDRHIVIHPPLEGWLRRNVSSDPRIKERLFVYFSLEGISYVVGLWTSGSHTAFYDVLNFGPWLWSFTPEDGLHLRRLFADPMTGERLGREAVQLERSKLRWMQDQADGESDEFHWERRTRALSGWRGRGRREPVPCTSG